MKSILLRTLTTLVLFLPFVTSANAATETYTIDSSHSYVMWHISHFGFSSPSGKWLAEGSLVLDEKSPKDSKVNVTIPVSNMITGIPKLDEHLKDKDFFDTNQYPTATFVSDKVSPTGKDTAKVHGILTVRGVSKPVTLDVKLNKMGESPISHKKTVGFTASTLVKRSEFGIDKYLPGLGDDVKINIEAEATLATG